VVLHFALVLDANRRAREVAGSTNSFFVKPASMTGLERRLVDYRLCPKMTCKPVMDALFSHKLLRNFNPNRRQFPFTAHAR